MGLIPILSLAALVLPLGPGALPASEAKRPTSDHMSVEAISWAFRQECRTPTTKLVLVALADHANHEGYCWPSQTRLADRVGIQERAIRRCLVSLEEDGLIARTERRHPNAGRFTSDGYLLAIPILDMAMAASPNKLKKSTKARMRARLIEHAGPVCWYCGASGSDDAGPDGKPWHVDRVVPGALGGTYHRDNVALSCAACNTEKGSKPLEKWRPGGAFSVVPPWVAEDQRAQETAGTLRPEAVGRGGPLDQRAQETTEPSLPLNTPKEAPTHGAVGTARVGDMWDAFTSVTGKDRWQLTATRRARLTKVEKLLRKRWPELDAVALFRAMVVSMWSDPWRREDQRSRHDPVNVYRSEEQIEGWAIFAAEEIQAGRDGSRWGQLRGQKAGSTISVTDDEARDATELRRHAQESEALRIRQQQDDIEELRGWYRALSPEEKTKLEEEVANRSPSTSKLAMDSTRITVTQEWKRRAEGATGGNLSAHLGRIMGGASNG